MIRNIKNRGDSLKYLRQLAVILFACFIGEILHAYLKLPIPGNVLGMLFLLFCLCTGIIKLEMVEEVSNFLLDHLAFFFLPAGVGLMTCFVILKGNWTAFISIIFISTIVVLAGTGITVQILMRRK